MNCFCIFFVITFVCFVACGQQPEERQSKQVSDPELKRLNAALDAAETQSDMDEASDKIAKYWERRLASVEKQISRKLGAEERKRFARSIGRWQLYRAQEVEFEADFYLGGSIEPMVANETYSGITENRVDELESLWTNTLKMEVDANPSATNGDLNSDESVAYVLSTDFHSKKILKELEYYVALESTYETNHFYVGATELDGSNLVTALVYWKEPRVLLNYGELAGDAPPSIEAWQGNNLKLGQDTVDTQDEIAGSNYLVTHRQWVDWMEECIYEGKMYVVTLNQSTNAFPNIRTNPDND